MFAFVVYTQVEVIRLYVHRWGTLDSYMELNPDIAPDQPSPEGEAGDESNSSVPAPPEDTRSQDPGV
jgi:hypothetical protein